MDIVRAASSLLSNQPQNMGQMVHAASKILQHELHTTMGATMSAADAQWLLAAFLLTRQAPLASDVVVHEVTLCQFLATARLQVAKAEKTPQIPPHRDWQEAMWLWSMVEGTGNLESTRLAPADLGIMLYSSSYLNKDIRFKHSLTALTDDDHYEDEDC
ncbi:hypothetical protein B0H12DRAFT_1082510 [Mycena haematopus]|nr:hypothetical protein B0H12DRAFT_1082510 [Mycena haematopus]